MDSTNYVPSLEQISFKLTEKVIPSTTNFHNLQLLDDSLDYTLSKASIQQMLNEDEEPSRLPLQLGQETFWKPSSLKTTCAGTTEASTIKKPSKSFFRQRIISSNKCNQKQPIKRRLSHHKMSLADQIVDHKLHVIPLNFPYNPYCLKQKKQKISSGKIIKKSLKIKEQELFQLHTSMKVKPVNLEVHTAREKNYLRRLMQNRGNILHAADSINEDGFIWTNRKNFRIH